MTRPGIIRADTIDLQDQKSPSAKDHTRQPSHPAALGAGPAAPHQAETLREVQAEAEEEQARSPRVSADWPNGETAFGNTTSLTPANLQQQDSLAVAQNGGGSGSTTEDSDMADAEGDDLDDDMMDKISSSPSIDDGGYSLITPRFWPMRVDSLNLAGIPQTSLSRRGSSEGSSSFLDDSVHSSLLSTQPVDPGLPPSALRHHLHSGEYGGHDESMIDELDQFLEDLGGFLPSWAPEVSPDDQKSFVSELDLMDGQDFSSSDTDEGIDVDDGQYYDENLMMVPYESSEEEDDDDRPFPTDSRFIDSGWGGECLQDLEDIDFEFVYALHTFVATVEGQANATKGDTMVLLDDSNSYWWLVRVVKDSSIGYLPAEHIETPTERLARLNKHRNIDLSAAMLGDQNDKPKNPLKKAMRRRNAKTVAFAAPTYFEASENEYSTEEEEETEAQLYAQHIRQAEAQKSDVEEDPTATVEPLSVRSQKRDPEDDKSDTKATSETSRNSDEIFDGKTERQTRNGTVRNTDSFFKDDTVETRKITITPNLLRDDSSTSTRASNESKEIRQRPSLDKLEKEAPEKNKDDKKKKDKKPGMLSGLFKRKDKKSKNQDEDIDELIYGKKTSGEDARLSPAPSKDSEEFEKTDEPAVQTRGQSPQRNPSKLQKQRTDGSPVKNAAAATTITTTTESEPKLSEPPQLAAPDRPPPTVSALEPSMRLVQPEDSTIVAPTAKAQAPEVSRAPAQVQQEDSQPRGIISKLRARSNSEAKEPKPEKVKKAKSRMEMDDFDSSADNSPVDEVEKDSLAEAPENKLLQRPIPGAFPDSYQSVAPIEDRSNGRDRLSESPVQVSPVENTRGNNPPALMVDSSSQEEPPSPVSSPSPELIHADEAREKKDERSFSVSTSTPTWSDAHLRTFFDDDTDIKDLLVVVYDKSGVVPAGPDHPITGSLFKEENAKLADITNRLDGMLGDWLARKSKATVSR